MIKIVCSEINTGKSTWMRKDFERHPKADGFVCIKAFLNDVHIGYNLVHLCSGRTRIFIRKLGYLERNWQEVYQIGENYSFCKQGFEFADEIALQALDRKATPFYLDEIGPLELQGKGFAKLFQNLLDHRPDIVVAVRKPLLTKVVEAFSISSFELVTPWEDGA